MIVCPVIHNQYTTYPLPVTASPTGRVRSDVYRCSTLPCLGQMVIIVRNTCTHPHVLTIKEIYYNNMLEIFHLYYSSCHSPPFTPAPASWSHYQRHVKGGVAGAGSSYFVTLVPETQRLRSKFSRQKVHTRQRICDITVLVCSNQQFEVCPFG